MSRVAPDIHLIPFMKEMRHTWDASGNLAWRQDVKFGGLEYCTYDFLDRLTSVVSAYSHSYSYDEIGNIVTFNGTSYTYGSKPHAVTDAGEAEYTYDANGNMVDRDGTTITWDVENRPTAVGSATFVYDGDGNRVKKTEGGQTTIYINKYYEKNTSTGTVTTYYYLGGRLVALRNGSNLRYVHQDHLGGTNVVTDTSGSQLGYTKYYPFGSTRNSSGSLDTDKEFTGQRLDGTGLYYYGARYYDPTIGRFISSDTLVPDFNNPQALNRYTYAFNNPFKYIDPTGHWPKWSNIGKWFKDRAKDVVRAAAVFTEVVIQALDPVLETLEPVLEPVAAAGEYIIENTSVPVLNALGAGITDVELNPARGYIGVEAEEGGFVAETLSWFGQATSGIEATGITIPLPIGSMVVVREAVAPPTTENHEEAHVMQQWTLGPYFLPLYLLGFWGYGYENHPLEIQAQEYSGEVIP